MLVKHTNTHERNRPHAEEVLGVVITVADILSGDGAGVGELVFTAVGAAVGTDVFTPVGEAVGKVELSAVGDAVGTDAITPVGEAVGKVELSAVGDAVGVEMGVGLVTLTVSGSTSKLVSQKSLSL